MVTETLFIQPTPMGWSLYNPGSDVIELRGASTLMALAYEWLAEVAGRTLHVTYSNGTSEQFTWDDIDRLPGDAPHEGL